MYYLDIAEPKICKERLKLHTIFGAGENVPANRPKQQRSHSVLIAKVQALKDCVRY